jgi:hypothetical protein
MSHQPDSRDLKISISSHKDVIICMEVSTGAPLSTQHFFCNPGLMWAMASRLRHQARSSFKIVSSVRTFKLHLWVLTYLQTVLSGMYLQIELLGAYFQTVFLGAYCFKLCLLVCSAQAVGQGMPLRTFKSCPLGASCSSCGAGYVATHLQIMSSGVTRSSHGSGYVATDTNRITYLHVGSVLYSFHFLSSRSDSIHSLSYVEGNRLRFQFIKYWQKKLMMDSKMGVPKISSSRHAHSNPVTSVMCHGQSRTEDGVLQYHQSAQPEPHHGHCHGGILFFDILLQGKQKQRHQAYDQEDPGSHHEA